jgi:hypothetical protein
MGMTRMLTKNSSGNLNRSDEMEGLGITERTILEQMKMNGVDSCGLDAYGWGQRSMAGTYGHSSELLGSITFREYFDHLSEH